MFRLVQCSHQVLLWEVQKLRRSPLPCQEELKSFEKVALMYIDAKLYTPPHASLYLPSRHSVPSEAIPRCRLGTHPPQQSDVEVVAELEVRPAHLSEVCYDTISTVQADVTAQKFQRLLPWRSTHVVDSSLDVQA